MGGGCSTLYACAPSERFVRRRRTTSPPPRSVSGEPERAPYSNALAPDAPYNAEQQFGTAPRRTGRAPQAEDPGAAGGEEGARRRRANLSRESALLQHQRPRSGGDVRRLIAALPRAVIRRPGHLNTHRQLCPRTRHLYHHPAGRTRWSRELLLEFLS